MRSVWRAIPISDKCVLCRGITPRLRANAVGQRAAFTGSFMERRRRMIATSPPPEERLRTTTDLSIIDCLDRPRQFESTGDARYKGERSKCATLSEFYRALATQDAECIWPVYTFLYQHQYHRHLTDHTYHQLFTFITRSRPTQRNLNRLLALVDDMKDRGMKLRAAEYNILINWAGGLTVPGKRSHHLTEGLALFSEMQQHHPPSLVAYNTLIHIASALSDIRMAQRLYHDMVAHDIQPDVYTYATLLHCMGRMGDLDGIERMVEDLEGMEHSAATSAVVWNAILAGYASNHQMDKADAVFRDMYGTLASSAINPAPAADSETFRIYMQAILREGRMDEALDLLTDMESYDIKPTTAIYNTLFASFMTDNPDDDEYDISSTRGNDDTVDVIRSLYESMRKHGVAPNSETMHTLVSALLDAGDVQTALKVFVRLSKQEDDTVSAAALQGVAVATLAKRRHTLDRSRARKIQPNQELLDRLSRLMAIAAQPSSPSPPTPPEDDV